jgi:probable rRNA maturation factor
MKGPVRLVEITVAGVAAPRWRNRLSRFCAKALAAAGFEEWEISLLLCGDVRITELNARYRGKHRPTDVLSFPGEQGGAPGRVAGDIAISLDTLRRNAAEFSVTEDEELKRLAVHGILHLAGMDHGRGKGRTMLALQEKLIEQLHAECIIGE